MRRYATVVALCGVQFVDVLGVTSAIAAIPAMLAGVSASSRATPIVATVYAMFFGGLLVLGARLGDRYGHRRILLVGIVSFGAVSILGATAQEVVQLVAARGLQGAAAAVSVPSALTLLLDAVRTGPATAGHPDTVGGAVPHHDALDHTGPAARAEGVRAEGSVRERTGRSGAAATGGVTRQVAIAAWSATGAAAGALGLLVGGALTDAFGWRAVFWVNLPVALVLVVGVRAFVSRERTTVDGTRLDPVGAVLMIAAVMALILGASLAEDAHRRAPGGALVAVGLAIGAAFVVAQRRARDPLIPRQAVADANLRSGTVVSFVNTATTSSAGVLATLLMQQQLGVSAVGAGLALLPFSLSVVVGSALSTPLGARLAPRPLAAVGLAGIAVGNVVLAATYGSVVGIVAGVAVAGTGLGIASVAATAVGTDVPGRLSGSATGLLNTSAQLGTALGVAALLVVAAAGNGSAGDGSAAGRGTAVAWIVAAVIAGAAAAATGRRWRR